MTPSALTTATGHWAWCSRPRLTDPSTADRPEAAVADHHERRFRGRSRQFRDDAVTSDVYTHGRRRRITEGREQRLLRLLDHVLCVFVLPLRVVELDGGDRPCDPKGGDDVHQGHWDAAQCRFMGCPTDRGMRLWRTVDADQDPVLGS